jgi:hypothetical protein
MGHKYCLSLIRYFEGQLLHVFYFWTWTVTICFFQNIYFFIFALYCHYNMQTFYEISNSQKPKHFNRFLKNLPKWKILGLK